MTCLCLGKQDKVCQPSNDMQVVKAVETSRPADLYVHIHILVSMGFCCSEKIYTTFCDMEPMIKAKQKSTFY